MTRVRIPLADGLSLESIETPSMRNPPPDQPVKRKSPNVSATLTASEAEKERK